MKNGKNFITGFKNLDDVLGITEPCVITVGARPCMGKTAFLTSVLTNAIKQNKKCCYFPFEMSIVQLRKRLICSVGDIPILTTKKIDLSYEEKKKVAKAFSTLIEADIGITDEYLTIEEISEKVKEYKPDIVFLDYLELIEDNDKNYFNKIKTIAKENNCIIFVASQMSRALESREDKRPCLSELKDNIVNCSDVILFIFRNSYYFMSDDDTEKDLQKAEIIIAKNNYGIPQTVELKFLSEIPKFVDAEDVKSE